MNNSKDKINVMVVDDSALMRKLLSDVLDNHPDINVVGTAPNGKIAVDKLDKLNPDVITLDVEMPIMNGIDALKEIQRIKATPTIMFSSLTKADAEITIQALELGAIDFIQKPTIRNDIESKAEEIITKILLASKAIKKNGRKILIPSKSNGNGNGNGKNKQTLKTVVIGSSTGGPQALKDVIPYLPEDIPAQFLIVQHMPPMFTDMFAKRLNSLSQLEVKEAQENDQLEMGKVLLAPGNFHMCVESNKIKLNQEPTVWGVRPAVDITLASAAKIYKENLICVILTGMGHDGSKGAAIVKKFGGYCIAEDQSTCVIYGMPRTVIEAGHADEVVPLNKMADAILKAVYR